MTINPDNPRKIAMLRIIADNGGSLTLRASNDLEMACIAAAGNWMQEMGYGEPTELGPDSLLIELSPKGMEVLVEVNKKADLRSPFTTDVEVNAWTHGVVSVLRLLRQEVENQNAR